MGKTQIQKALEKLNLDFESIPDTKTAASVRILLNLVEVLAHQNEELRSDNQALRDEINRLKGEQGKPDIREQSKNKESNDTDHSSEKERNKDLKKNPRKPKRKKKGMIKVDKIVKCEIDKNSLPSDATLKYYKKRLIQDIEIQTNNIEFWQPVYYSPSLKKTFVAPLPQGYQGEFGPGIRSLVISLNRDSGMTESAIKRFLETFDIHISNSTISVMLTENHDVFHAEKEDIYKAAREANPYQHMDDTGCRVKGKNQYAHILCNPYCTVYFTRPQKDRLTLLQILCHEDLKFVFNEKTYSLLKESGMSNKCYEKVKNEIPEGSYLPEEFSDILKQLFPDPHKQKTNRNLVSEAAALVYYEDSPYMLDFLISDDAPQFNKISKHKGACWVHEGRHYKKLNPIVPLHREFLDHFLERFWDYYVSLLAYKETPTEDKALILSKEFDNLFGTKTGYEELDKRIFMTLTKKSTLLLVLEFPFLMLHNNPAELGARAQARMRDINLHTMSENGTKAKDTFATIVQTARKLGVNIYQYLYDRMSQEYKMPSLASIITDRSKSQSIIS